VFQLQEPDRNGKRAQQATEKLKIEIGTYPNLEKIPSGVEQMVFAPSKITETPERLPSAESNC